MDRAGDGEPVLELLVGDRVPADDVRAGLVHRVLPAAQHVGEHGRAAAGPTGKPTMFMAVIGSPPIANTSESALVAATRPKSYGSSTIGAKKSSVCTSASSGESWKTPASSKVSRPTRMRGSVRRSSGASAAAEIAGAHLGGAARAARELRQADDVLRRRGGHAASPAAQPALATHSISTRTPRGRPATATVERAGREPPMCFA